jgi:hypothetical protein
MHEYDQVYDGEQALVLIDRLTLKGKSILEFCLEQEKELCVKGFIDCQMEMGGIYTRVVEKMVDHIDHKLHDNPDRKRRAILIDLQSYAVEQLQGLHSINGTINAVSGP